MNTPLIRRARSAGAALAVAMALFAGMDAQSAQPAATKPLLDAEVRARADALLARMTPEEKAGQLTQYFNFGFDPSESKRVHDEMAAGRAGSLLFVTDPAELDRLQHIGPAVVGDDGARVLHDLPHAGGCVPLIATEGSVADPSRSSPHQPRDERAQPPAGGHVADRARPHAARPGRSSGWRVRAGRGRACARHRQTDMAT